MTGVLDLDIFATQPFALKFCFNSVHSQVFQYDVEIIM